MNRESALFDDSSPYLLPGAVGEFSRDIAKTIIPCTYLGSVQYFVLTAPEVLI